MNIDKRLLEQVSHISHQAGIAILEIYSQDFAVQAKADESPLTEADLASHNTLVDALNELTPDIPILSEESEELLKSGLWRQWTTYWLLDPLDGTKEFVKRNGEFTVNIALIHEHRPILGVVHVPVSGITYAGAHALGAFKFTREDIMLNQKSSINVIKNPVRPYKVVASRSHRSPELEEYLGNLGECDIVSMGSSLKCCLVAEGVADCYPRLGLTSEWDTAAAQGVVEAAGGKMDKLDGTPLLYNTKDEILNPYFMVHGNNGVDWFKDLPEN